MTQKGRRYLLSGRKPSTQTVNEKAARRGYPACRRASPNGQSLWSISPAGVIANISQSLRQCNGWLRHEDDTLGIMRDAFGHACASKHAICFNLHPRSRNGYATIFDRVACRSTGGGHHLGEVKRDERLVTLQSVGNSTIIMDSETGHVIMAFESDTWQGWMPFEPGSVLEVNCRFGGE